MPEPIARSRSRPARRGYLILAALLVTAVVIFNADLIRNALRPKLEVVALVPEAPGIRIGSSVLIEGVNAGRVTGVEVIREGDSIQVALDLRLEGEARALVTLGSDVRPVRRRLIGEAIVLVAAGRRGDPPVRQGDTLRGQPRPSPDVLLARAGELPAVLADLREHADEIMDLIDRRAPALDHLARQLDEVSAAAAILSDGFEAGSLAGMLDPEGLPARIRSVRQRLDAVAAATTQARDRYSTDPESPLGSGIQDIGARITAVDDALADLDTRVREGGGFVGRIQEDSALNVAVRGISEQMDSIRAEAFSILWRMFAPRTQP